MAFPAFELGWQGNGRGDVPTGDLLIFKGDLPPFLFSL
jgi:hypothetical protein